MSKKLEITILFFLLSVVVFFSTFHLTESPSVWYDEGIYIQTAANLEAGEGMTFQFAPDQLGNMMSRFTVGYPLIYLLALVFKIFGANILAARGLMVFFILALVTVVYFFIKKRFGPVLALWSLALVATFPPLYGNGKSVLGEVPGLLFLIVFLFIMRQVISGRQSSTKSQFMLAGLFAGLGVATKPVFLLFLPALVIGVYIAWRRKNLSPKNIGLIGAGVVLPLIVWFVTQFVIGSSGTSFLSVFNFYANPYGIGNIIGVVKNNLINFLTEAGPLYLLIIMLVWFLALIIRKRKKDLIPAEEIIAFCFSVLVCLAYLRIAGWHRYIFPAQVVALLYFVPSLYVCIQLVPKKIKIMRLGLPVTVVGLSLWGIYGLSFNSWVADFYSSRKTAFWENYFKNVPVKESAFFYDTPEVAIFYPSRNYYQYLALPAAGGPFGAEGLSAIGKGDVDQIIIRADTLESLGRGGKWFAKYRPKLQSYKYTILEKK